MSDERHQLNKLSKSELVAQLLAARRGRPSAAGREGAGLDVAVLTTAREALEHGHAQLRQLVDLIPTLVAVKTRSGHFALANPAMHALYGVENGSMPGRHQGDFHLSPEVVERYLALDRLVIDSGQARQSPNSPFTRADGTVRIIDWSKVPWPAADDGEVRVLVVGNDVTEQRRAEQRLLGQERLAAIGQLTATVSHELRNPLSVIRPALFTITTLLGAADQKTRTALERIERSVDRCDAIINELLDFTRLQALQLVDADLSAWLTELLDELGIPPGLHVKRAFASRPIPARFDTARLRQVVINVVDNAVEAMQTAGQDGAMQTGAELVVNLLEQPDRVELSFKDNGPGMSEETLARAFEPLFSTKGFGTGLGLPLVRQILEQHGGGVLMRSRPEAGSLVIAWLPVAR